MPKTRKDFEPYDPPWLIEDWFPLGHRGMDTAPEGSFKTMWGCWISICVASGTPVFGYPVNQGTVLIVDEETPEHSLNYHLDRFSRGLGYRFCDLPVHIINMEGFEFGRKTEMKKLLKTVDLLNPTFIRLDSMIAMLPSGREHLNENDCKLGETIRDDLNKLLTPQRSLLLAAHAKKYVADLTLGEIHDKSMQSIVRGHGSIVGEGCDTGYIIKKISEHPEPTRFCIGVKVRRQAIPGKKTIYVEMKEERYGEGWARLEEIPPSALPPSYPAKKVYTLLKNNNSKIRSSQWIVRSMALQSKGFCRVGVEELLRRKVIIESEPEKFELNMKMKSQCDTGYLKVLDPTI